MTFSDLEQTFKVTTTEFFYLVDIWRICVRSNFVNTEPGDVTSRWKVYMFVQKCDRLADGERCVAGEGDARPLLSALSRATVISSLTWPSWYVNELRLFRRWGSWQHDQGKPSRLFSLADRRHRSLIEILSGVICAVHCCCSAAAVDIDTELLMLERIMRQCRI